MPSKTVFLRPQSWSRLKPYSLGTITAVKENSHKDKWFHFRARLEIGQFLTRIFWMIAGGHFLSRPLWFIAETRECKGYERGTERNFLHSFPLSGTAVVQSYLRGRLMVHA